jgi:hypothetical protein
MDDHDDVDYKVVLSVESDDSNYDGFAVAPLSLSNVDDEVLGLIITTVDDDTETSEGGDDWDEPQELTVVGFDDDEADGDQSFDVEFAITSNGDDYDGLEVSALTLTNVDDD